MPINVVTQDDVTPKAPIPAVEAEENSASDDEQSSDETPEASETTEIDNAEGEEPEADQEIEVEDKGEEKGEEKRPKKGGFQKRIDKLSKEKAEARAKAEYWETEFYKAKTSKPQESQPKEALKKESAPDGKPSPDSFDTHSDYVEALTDWKLEQREKQREVKQREAQFKTEQQKQVESFQSKILEFKKSHDDFDELTESVDDIPMTLGVQEAILQSDVGAQVMYELAKNREEYERINKLGPIAAAKEIGKIEARLSKPESSKEEKKITKAPKPLNPVKANGSSKKWSIDDPNIPQVEFEKLVKAGKY